MAYLIFLGCFAVYVHLMAPGIALEDSGEFVTAAITLSLTHPPGYPLYLLLGKVFSWLPVGSPAFRLSILSAASAALATAFTYSFSRELIQSRLKPLPLIACALALAFSPALIRQGIIADKYALNMALLCGAMLLCLRAWREGRTWLAPLALLAGLSLTHHMQVIYLAPAAAAILWRERRGSGFRRLLLLVTLVAIPLSLKPVALPLCAESSPSLLYGRIDRASTLNRYLSAKDYSGRFAAYTPAQKTARFWTHGITELWRQAGVTVLAMALVGAIALWRDRRRSILLAGGAGAAIALLLVSVFNIAGVGYYLLPVIAFLCGLAAAGMAEAESWRRGRTVTTVVAILVIATATLRGPMKHDLSRYYGSADWARNLLASLAPHAVLVTRHDDDFYPPMYFQRVLEERRDVILIHRPFITRLWHHAQVERLYPGFTTLDPDVIPWGQTVEPEALVNLFLRSQLPVREVAFTYLANAETAGGFLLRPDGCAFKVARRPTEPPLPREREFVHQLKRFRLRSIFGPFPEGSRFREVAGAPAILWTHLALRWWDRGDREEARACLKRALTFPYTRVRAEDLERVRKNMGIY